MAIRASRSPWPSAAAPLAQERQGPGHRAREVGDRQRDQDHRCDQHPGQEPHRGALQLLDVAVGGLDGGLQPRQGLVDALLDARDHRVAPFLDGRCRGLRLQRGGHDLLPERDVELGGSALDRLELRDLLPLGGCRPELADQIQGSLPRRLVRLDARAGAQGELVLQPALLVEGGLELERELQLLVASLHGVDGVVDAAQGVPLQRHRQQQGDQHHGEGHAQAAPRGEAAAEACAPCWWVRLARHLHRLASLDRLVPVRAGPAFRTDLRGCHAPLMPPKSAPKLGAGTARSPGGAWRGSGSACSGPPRPRERSSSAARAPTPLPFHGRCRVLQIAADGALRLPAEAYRALIRSEILR